MTEDTKDTRSKYAQERFEATGIDLEGDEPLPIDPKDQEAMDHWREEHKFKGHDWAMAKYKKKEESK